MARLEQLLEKMKKETAKQKRISKRHRMSKCRINWQHKVEFDICSASGEKNGNRRGEFNFNLCKITKINFEKTAFRSDISNFVFVCLSRRIWINRWFFYVENVFVVVLLKYCFQIEWIKRFGLWVTGQWSFRIFILQGKYKLPSLPLSLFNPFL